MSKKRDIFELIDRDCVSPVSAEVIKTYIENILKAKVAAEGKSKKRKEFIKMNTKWGVDLAIKVVHCKREPNHEYIGRPSPLGNPFPLPKGAEKGSTLPKYREWLTGKIESNNC